MNEGNPNIYLQEIPLCKRCRHFIKACHNPEPFFDYNYETKKCGGFEPPPQKKAS